MRYIALLRGINVGKGPRIEMKKLRENFEAMGYVKVSTYINSGNVIFEAGQGKENFRRKIEKSLKSEFGFEIPALVLSLPEIKKISGAIPALWKNDSSQKTDVAFLFPEIDSVETIDKLPLKRDYLDIRYVKGAIFWNVDRNNYNKSHLNKVAGHRFYLLITVRNVNTVRFLAGMKNNGGS